MTRPAHRSRFRPRGRARSARSTVLLDPQSDGEKNPSPPHLRRRRAGRSPRRSARRSTTALPAPDASAAESLGAQRVSRCDTLPRIAFTRARRAWGTSTAMVATAFRRTRAADPRGGRTMDGARAESAFRAGGRWRSALTAAAAAGATVADSSRLAIPWGTRRCSYPRTRPTRPPTAFRSRAGLASTSGAEGGDGKRPQIRRADRRRTARRWASRCTPGKRTRSGSDERHARCRRAQRAASRKSRRRVLARAADRARRARRAPGSLRGRRALAAEVVRRTRRGRRRFSFRPLRRRRGEGGGRHRVVPSRDDPRSYHCDRFACGAGTRLPRVLSRPARASLRDRVFLMARALDHEQMRRRAVERGQMTITKRFIVAASGG